MKNVKIENVHPLKKTDIKSIRKKTRNVEKELHNLENAWKSPKKIKDIDKWQKAIEKKVDLLTKTLTEANFVIKNNVDSIKEMRDILQHNNENLKTIFDILKYLFQKDAKDKGAIYNTLKKKLAAKYQV
jgi:valyl-tRNA synthetase